jgi:hypothetical protein
MKRKIRNLTVVLVVMLGLLAAFSEAPSAHAWPWSTQTKVGASVGWRGNIMLSAVRCQSATLVANGRTYYGSVSNPWYSTKCNISFSNVPVNTNAYITVRASYLFTSRTVSVWRWVPKPSLTENVTVADIWLN